MDNIDISLITNAITITGIQLMGILGVFFFLGFVLSILQHQTNKHYHVVFGWKGILWTAWIGTPFHELGHYLFAKLFFHKVEELSLFSPNKETGGLGHVEHSYKRHNLYQLIGNFFIGAAPMIFGIGILTLLLYVLLPEGKQIIMILMDANHSLPSLVQTMSDVATLFFSKDHVSSWYFWLFLYISFAISAHSAPSAYDRRGMWRGFVWIVILLFLVNLSTLLFHINITSALLRPSQFFTVILAISLYTLFISVLHYIFVLCFIVPLRYIKS